MLCRCARALHATLLELDRLLARRHFGAALDLATRALEGRLAEPDIEARLRIGRAHALWMMGRVGPARREVGRAMGASSDPLTRARAEDALALFAWKDAHFADAQSLAEGARRVYEARALRSGLARSLQAEAGLLADRGQLEAALSAQTRRVEALAQGTPERLAEARADRSTLLTLLGRWTEAGADLQRAAGLVRREGEPGVLVLKRATLELSRGDLEGSRRLLEQAREAERLRPSSPRVLADACLLGSDVALAKGLTRDAENEAAAAIRAFVQLGDRGGECRSRVRRAQSLLALGRFQEAARESESALRLATPAGTGMEALAQLTLGRALLRTRPAAAPAVFERAERAAQCRPDLTHAARLGLALAIPGSDSSEKIDRALGALEQWGDLRLLGFARAEVESLRGGRAFVLQPVSARLAAEAQRARETALVEAALAISEEGEWPLRWARAMRAMRRIIPFARVALLAEGDSFELREELDRPSPLPASDLAREAAHRARGPAAFEVRGLPGGPAPWERRLAMVAPVNESTFLYAEVADGTDGDEGALDFLVAMARVVAAHRPCGPASIEAEAPALPGFVGRSEPMRALFIDVHNAAQSDHATVHVFGETGTGKERIARAIHDLSPRARGPFVAVNAASLSEELFQSQLFGHVRGAFTGAVQDTIGYVGEAEGGTLFLDEVADLSTTSQARLLRFLQDKECQRLGERGSRKANVRVLTAANVCLREHVRKGLFRDDLRYRIDALTLVAPPLRARGDDVVLLARHFLAGFAAKDKLAVPRLAADALTALGTYSWPGNVRELQGEMQRLVVLVRGRAIHREDLRPHIASVSSAPSSRALSEARLALERDHVVAALRRHEGSRTRAAADLGISRQALHDKIRRHGLPTGGASA